MSVNKMKSSASRKTDRHWINIWNAHAKSNQFASANERIELFFIGLIWFVRWRQRTENESTRPPWQSRVLDEMAKRTWFYAYRCADEINHRKNRKKNQRNNSGCLNENGERKCWFAVADRGACEIINIFDWENRCKYNEIIKIICEQ